MIPLDYLALRLIRRFVPASLVRWAMRLRLGVEPGLETRQPAVAGDRYESALEAMTEQLQGKRILILGYGGFYGLAVDLLQRSAGHIVLLDPYARVNHKLNFPLAQQGTNFLSLQKDQVVPNPQYITIIQDLNREYKLEKYEPIDLVLSSSVLEHVSEPREIIHDLSLKTHPEGIHIHFVDLRDHFFKYPFEMLCHSEEIWSRFLNPSSNLNRFRAWDFEGIFRQIFQKVEIEIFEKEPVKFRSAKGRIRPEFISGNDDTDCAARILIKASHPVDG